MGPSTPGALGLGGPWRGAKWGAEKVEDDTELSPGMDVTGLRQGRPRRLGEDKSFLGKSKKRKREKVGGGWQRKELSVEKGK